MLKGTRQINQLFINIGDISEIIYVREIKKWGEKHKVIVTFSPKYVSVGEITLSFLEVMYFIERKTEESCRAVENKFDKYLNKICFGAVTAE